MIKQWSIRNFKSIKEEARINFAPLTLFVGQNSAGKSTLIQSILLTAQTIQSNVAARSVVLNGRIIRLGSFADICANNSIDDLVAVSFELTRPAFAVENISVSGNPRYYYTTEFQQKMNLVRVAFSFSAGTLSERNKELQLQPRLERASITYQPLDMGASTTFEFVRRDEPPDARLRSLDVERLNARIPDLSALEYEVVYQKGALKAYGRGYRVPTSMSPAGVLLRHFLPVAVVGAYDAIADEVDAIFDVLSDPSAAIRFRVLPTVANSTTISSPEIRKIIIEASRAAAESLHDFGKDRVLAQISVLEKDFSIEGVGKLHTLLQPQGRKALALQLSERELEIKRLLRAGRPPRNEIAPFPAPEPIVYAADYVTSFFSERLMYLGPLRDEPKAIYPIAGYNDPKDIGFRGEFTAAVLDNNKTSIVKYVPSAHFPFSSTPQTQLMTTSLVDAVRDWIEYLGIAMAVATEDMGKLGHKLTIAVSKGDHLHDLTHVGVGVSQALPIVVLSLLADSGSTLIFEQPELHLNPKVQTRLADFFMSLAFAGKQCVVETHSEYLISRLRYLSAVAKDVPISQLIKIYFVEKPADQSIYSEVEISEAGVIKNWPDGFFDETERNSAAIIKAQIDRSRARRNRKDEGDGS
jgi:predicted ATPase